MSDGYVDGLWPHFAPLWTDLRGITPDVLLAGGYGLFLKQRWLASQIGLLATERGNIITTEKGGGIIVNEIRTVVDLSRWIDGVPRATKDFDLVVGLDLIASPTSQGQVAQAIEKHEFAVVPGNERWQFRKKITDNQNVMLDFHAFAPGAARADLRVGDLRIKPKPSLGLGIHGRKNPEAVGSNLHPFAFTMDSVAVQVPNPVTMAMMKMVAMRDRRLKGQDANLLPEHRSTAERLAVKHANDLFKVVAMATREENDRIGEVLADVAGAECFDATVHAFAEYFRSDDGWGTQVVRGSWRPDDFELIRTTLGGWFPSN
jgi:hypothetical protein